jgi:hypothetical protein
MAIGGGTFSVLGGGKFSNGAFAGAMTHLYNEEMTKEEIDMHNKKVMATEQGFKNAYGNNGEAYMMGDAKVGRAVLSIGIKSTALGITFGMGIYELGYSWVTSFSAGATTTIVSSGIYTELEMGFGNTKPKNIIKNSIRD